MAACTYLYVVISSRKCHNKLYDNTFSRSSDNFTSIAICEIDCDGNEKQLSDCDILQDCSHSTNKCSHIVFIQCGKEIFFVMHLEFTYIATLFTVF